MQIIHFVLLAFSKRVETPFWPASQQFCLLLIVLPQKSCDKKNSASLKSVEQPLAKETEGSG